MSHQLGYAVWQGYLHHKNDWTEMQLFLTCENTHKITNIGKRKGTYVNSN